MTALIARLAGNRIVRNTTALTVSQLLVRVLSIVYVAALARYVGPEGIGSLTTASVLTGLLVLIVAPGVTTLLMRDVAADKTKAADYVATLLTLRLVLGVVFALATVVAARLLRYDAQTVQLAYIYIAVYLLDSLVTVVTSTLRAFERMKYEAVAEVLRELLNIGLSLLAIYLRAPLATIVLVSAVAQACKLAYVYFALRTRFVRPQWRIRWDAAWALFKQSTPFAVLMILPTLQAYLGTFILSAYHPAGVVGIYASANSLVNMLLLVPGAFAGAIFPVFARQHAADTEKLRVSYRLAFKFLLVTGFALGLGAMLIGDRVIALIYGDQFEASAGVLRILAIYLMMLVGYANGSLMTATGMQRFFAWTQAGAVALNAALALALVPAWGPAGAAVAWVAPAVVTFFVHSFASHRKLGLGFPWRLLLQTTAAGLLMVLAVKGAEGIGLPWPVAALVAAPLAYVPGLFLFGAVNTDDLAAVGVSRRAEPTGDAYGC